MAEQQVSLKVRKVWAMLEERMGDLHIVVRDDHGNEMVLKAQSTTADRIRVEPVSKKGVASIDVHDHQADFYRGGLAAAYGG